MLANFNVPLLLYIALPDVALLSVKLDPETSNSALDSLKQIAPPNSAELSVKLQLVTVTLLAPVDGLLISIAPPQSAALLFSKVQSEISTIGVLPIAIAPPAETLVSPTLLSLKIQLTILADTASLIQIAPPAAELVPGEPVPNTVLFSK